MKKERKRKLKTIIQGGVFLFLLFLLLSGLSCGKKKERVPLSPLPEGKEEEKIPQGWQTYSSERFNLSFAYPKDWHVLEDENLGILLSSKEFPKVLPPDLLGVEIVVGVSKENKNELLEKLKEEDPEVKSEEIIIKGEKGEKYEYRVGPDNEPTLLYRIPRGSEFVEVGLDKNLDPEIIKNFIESLTI